MPDSILDPLKGLRCPLDQQPLARQGNGLHCGSGHQFDCAKSGYVNLLPVQNKRSREPGDSKEMVAARRGLLDSGAYQPLAEALLADVVRCVSQNSTSDGALRLLDAGCGEGYYLEWLYHGLQQQGLKVHAQGLDISKWAVQAASKRSREIGWLVGSNAALPVADQQLDQLLCLFGFPVFDEFARVLKPGGGLLMADPGAEHLIELRRLLYPEIRPHRQPRMPDQHLFELAEAQSVRFQLQLESPGAIQQLLAMTPHLHKAPRAGREVVRGVSQLQLTVDVQLRRFRTVDTQSR